MSKKVFTLLSIPLIFILIVGVATGISVRQQANDVETRITFLGDGEQENNGSEARTQLRDAADDADDDLVGRGLEPASGPGLAGATAPRSLPFVHLQLYQQLHRPPEA